MALPSTHLFLSLTDALWGELLYAARIAAQLRRAGDRVVFAGPPSAGLVLRDLEVDFRALPPGGDWLALVQQLIAAERCAALILVDLAFAYTHLEVTGLDATFVDQIPVPVIGLDVWDLECTNLLMERGSAGWILSRHCRDVSRRLIPSPMIRPSGWRDPLAAGVYNSLPDELPAPARRDELRARLGLGAGDRLIVLPTAVWQQPTVDPSDGYVARLTRRFPALVAQLLARLGGRVRIAHVGLRPLAELSAALGAHYRWQRQLSRSQFIELLTAADVMLSFNAMATTIGTAALLGVPVLLGGNSFGGQDAGEVLARLPFAPSPAVRAWLIAMAPLHPFRVWPFGLYRFTTPIVQDNPCVEMTRRFEILDEEGFVSAAQVLLWDDEAAAAVRARMASCLEAVRRLPSAVDVVAHHLRG
jgi:hypothetical protein